MSNTSLVNRIADAATRFEAGEVSLVQLREIVETAGGAIESLPYDMVAELQSIGMSLFIESSYEEEGCETKPQEALRRLRAWLARVPG